MQPNPNRARVRATTRGMAALLTLLAMTNAGAALIEIPAGQLERQAADGQRGSLSWQESTRRARLAAGGAMPLHADYAQFHVDRTMGVARVGNTKVWAGAAPPAAEPSLFAALEAPFGSMDAAATLPETESELWALILVGAGLIAYQLRRKSRMGSIRVRPL